MAFSTMIRYQDGSVVQWGDETKWNETGELFMNHLF